MLFHGDFLPNAVAPAVIDQSDRAQVVADLLEGHLVSERTINDCFPLDDARGLLIHSAMKIRKDRQRDKRNQEPSFQSQVTVSSSDTHLDIALSAPKGLLNQVSCAIIVVNLPGLGGHGCDVTEKSEITNGLVDFFIVAFQRALAGQTGWHTVIGELSPLKP